MLFLLAGFLPMACFPAAEPLTRAELSAGIESLEGLELVEFLWENDVELRDHATLTFDEVDLVESDETASAGGFGDRVRFRDRNRTIADSIN